jgi:glycoprotein 6-alpha-L-fucosyltransferase
LGGLTAVYDDIKHLADSDFIVGTFSSQVTRAAYEIAQANSTYGSPDSTFNYHSVDSMFYFGGQNQYR